jgi:hypothetical protein
MDTENASLCETLDIPAHLLQPLEVFGDSYIAKANEGAIRLANSKVAIVGLARNCGGPLRANLEQALQVAEGCRDWRLHIESNDCEDDTVNVLAEFCRAHKEATFHYQILGRKQFSAEFAGPRTIALAEYRDACQRWVRACAADADYVIAIDWDAWGGFSVHGLLNGVGWLVELQGAYGMAAVSLLGTATISMGEDNTPKLASGWAQYDAWALRLNSYWDDYTAGLGGWKHQWIPPVGSPPVRVCSAFGGLVVYRTDAYLKGTYDGVHDCEHVAFHKSIEKATGGQGLYLCPSMRTVMRWMNARHNGDD